MTQNSHFAPHPRYISGLWIDGIESGVAMATAGLARPAGEQIEMKWPARPPALVCTVQLLAQAGSGPIAGLPALTHARARARRPQCVAKHNY